MAGTSMRTVETNNTKPVEGASHNMASHSMSGGRKRRSAKARKSKARRMGRSKSMRRSRSMRGMMGSGFGAVLKEALVPFGIFALQKRTQRRRARK